MAIDTVAKSWGAIADEANCSVMLSHHSRKPGGEAVTIEASRGASALIDAVRFAQALNTMTDREAEKAGVQEKDRRCFFSAYNGKTTHSRPAATRDWFKLEVDEPGERSSRI